VADAGRAPDFADLNPTFSSRLAQLRAELDRQGIKYNLASGYRTPEYQAQMRANHDAAAAKQPIPYPGVETPSVVAPAWRSFHNYGLATDFTSDDPSNYAKIRALAPQFGLSGIGSTDPGHIQLAGTLDQDINQYHLQGWRPASRPAPDQGAIAYGGPPPGQPPANLLNRGTGSQAPIAAQPSGNMTHEQFIRDYAQKIGINPEVAIGIANAEGLRAWSPSNPNAGSYVDRTNGQPWSFGDFQLNTRNGMGVDAQKAGIDPKDPNQWQKADMFALDQMKQGGLGPWKGDAFAKSWGAKPITGGTTLTTNTANAGAVNQLGQPTGQPATTAPPDTAVAAAPPDQQNWGQKLFAKPPPTKDAQGNTVEGKSPVEKLAGSFAKPAAAAPAAPEQQQIMPVQDPDPGLAPASSQLFTAVQAAAAKPLSWNSRPFGYGVGQMPIDPTMMAGQGTTLNSSGYGYG
jgi:D-alanyl-D-alanine carboxypeptidase